MDCSNAPRTWQKVSGRTLLIQGSEAVIRIYQRNTLITSSPNLKKPIATYRGFISARLVVYLMAQ